jgi:hypothetical protein
LLLSPFLQQPPAAQTPAATHVQPPPREGGILPGRLPSSRCPLSSAPRPQQLPLVGASARSSPRSAPPPTSVAGLWRARPWPSPLAARARSSASPPTDGALPILRRRGHPNRRCPPYPAPASTAPAPPAPCASAVVRWPPPTGRSSLVHRQSSSTHHHTRLLKQKDKCVCLRRELKAGRHKSYLDGGEDDELVIAVGPPLRHLRHRDDAKVLDILVVERARDMTSTNDSGWATRRSASQAHQRGSTPSRYTT